MAMGYLCECEAAKRAGMGEPGMFHEWMQCNFNECSHCRWEPAGKGERRGAFVCAIDPWLQKIGEGFYGEDVYECRAYNPTRPHRYYYEPPRNRVTARRLWGGCDGATHSGHEALDSWGVDIHDFGYDC